MKPLRLFLLLALAALLTLATPAFATKVHLPPGGDTSGFILTVTIPVDNQTGDWVSGGTYTLNGSTLTRNGTGGGGVPPYSVGTTQMVINIGSDWAEGTYAFSLFGAPGTGSPAGAVAFDDADPTLTIELILDSSQPPCHAGEPCHNQSAAYPTTVSAPANLIYSVTDLRDPYLSEDDTVSYGVNSSGQVVGAFSYLNTQYAFRFSNGVMTDLGTPSYSVANAINVPGQVVGIYDTNDGSEHAFLYSNGALTDLGTLPGGTNSEANGINVAGQIAGTADTSAGQFHAFLYQQGVMTDLGTLPGGGDSYGECVNYYGQVVGTAYNSNGVQHGFLYSKGAMTDLGTLPGGTGSQAHDINALGQVVGTADTSAG